MDDMLRYSCQMALPGFDANVQMRLAKAKVLLVGSGGLGCPAAQYLASSGVGTVAVADDDVVSVSNLHRQILYTPADAGRKKATVAAEKLQAQNPDVQVVPLLTRVTSENIMTVISGYDIVVDCTDNFETRYLLNDACVLAGVPLVYGAIYQYEGQVAVWNITNADGTKSPNYRDLYPDVNTAAVPNCVVGGVIPTIAGIIGCMQANEVIKYITGTGEMLAGRLLVFDAQTMQSRVLKLGVVTKTDIKAFAQYAAVKNITAGELQASIDQYQLIDVRTSEEREVFNIGGKHVPLSELVSAVIEADKAIVCYCASGKRSDEAARILSVKFPGLAIYSLQGGLSAYSSTPSFTSSQRAL